MMTLSNFGLSKLLFKLFFGNRSVNIICFHPKKFLSSTFDIGCNLNLSPNSKTCTNQSSRNLRQNCHTNLIKSNQTKLDISHQIFATKSFLVGINLIWNCKYYKNLPCIGVSQVKKLLDDHDCCISIAT